ncbi:MAG: gamma-glutamyltransferase, partial [Alphaproteobacteria bacterium]|nr:gamma-glutamyltransferase [Alphaproteobacteria bacterium]
ALPVVADPAAGEDAARAVLAAAIADPARLAAAPGAVADAAGGDTSVLVVMDAAGNAVSLIQSVSGPFGSGLVAPGTGVVLNNRMRGFSTDPASPNRVAPGRRPAHTLTPAMVYKDGRPFMTIATPGMAGQTCTLAQVLARVLARGEALDQAIAAPRWSVTPKGEPIVEATLAPAVRDALAAEERTLTTVGGSLTFGSIKAVAFERNGLVAVADHRRVAGAAGW